LPRYALVYEERRIAIFEGETILGRGLSCDVRFNSPTVSREHTRLLVSDDQLVAENMSSTTGTRVNGRPLSGKWSLREGDELTLGPVSLRVERIETGVGSSAGPAPDIDDGLPEEATMPGEYARFDEYAQVAPHAIPFHNCPSCRAKVAFNDNSCPRCHYAWPPSFPAGVTQRHTVPGLQTIAAGARSLPLVYASDELTLDITVTDLGKSRLFVPSLLLDPAGTHCEITVLPDGDHPMTMPGVVKSVRDNDGPAGPAGMEITLNNVPPIVQAWIDRWLDAQK
jgi:hypothetical protein